jgi:hypothetical protein
VVLTVALCTTATPVAAQRSGDVGVTEATSPRPSAPVTVLPGPRLPALIQSVTPRASRVGTEGAWPLAASSDNTITISTVTLLLIIIIIILLV